MRNFKDESFIGQYLSPEADARVPPVRDRRRREGERARGRGDPRRRRLPRACARRCRASTTSAAREPNIQVWSVNLRGDRSLTLRHTQHNDRPLHDGAQEVLKHVARLWGFGVHLESVDQWGDVSATGRSQRRRSVLIGSPARRARTGCSRPNPALREGGADPCGVARFALALPTARRSCPDS